MIKVSVDIFLSLLILLILTIPLLIISLLVLFSSPGPILYWSDRIGKNNVIYSMPKFRTMKIDTPLVDTANLNSPEKYITSIGKFLRTYSLDELPQVLSVLAGDMSLVGPRPALPSQFELINLRTNENIHKVKPGITGLAQISGRDNITINEKITYDKLYLEKRNLFYDLNILYKTISAVLRKKNISH